MQFWFRGWGAPRCGPRLNARLGLPGALRGLSGRDAVVVGPLLLVVVPIASVERGRPRGAPRRMFAPSRLVAILRDPLMYNHATFALLNTCVSMFHRF